MRVQGAQPHILASLENCAYLNSYCCNRRAQACVFMSAYDAIYAVVRQIPSGKVATYGQVAELANLGGQARLVGYALYRVTHELAVPWHRVVNAKGEISESPFRHGDDHLQYSLLKQEGVEFSDAGKINLRRYRWQPEAEQD